ncbi:hypothetical protein PM082_009002 [Marasmius tenuissimus]|nr:hypothetical protein PM082_009002 [Marasmius tenuissimus]
MGSVARSPPKAMWKLTALLVLLHLSHSVHAQTEESAPFVDLGYARYQGVFNETTNVTTFFGIRYAAAPIGDLRWRAPASPPIVADIQQADTEPPRCFQAHFGANPMNPFPPEES